MVFYMQWKQFNIDKVLVCIGKYKMAVTYLVVQNHWKLLKYKVLFPYYTWAPQSIYTT